MKKILLAEDDRISRVMLQAVLQKWGYQVESAGNGDDALAKLLDPQGPSLAILDWMMPVLDGLEVCKRVRDVPGIRPIHLILLTSKSKASDAAAALGVGADDHISKPYDLIELQARIEMGFRRIRWARDCAKGHLRDHQVQGLLEVNRLAMRQSIGADSGSIGEATGHASLGAVWKRVDRSLKGNLRTTFEPVADDGDPVVAMGEEKLLQLVANLYMHWRAAMPDGGEVAVSWARTDSGKLRVVCRDRGGPVSDVQILSGALPEHEGAPIAMGIGILFSKALAEAVGGGLRWARPEEGSGLVLEMDLPVLVASGKPT